MAKVVSLINMKGGVGKSTLAVNLAWCFALPEDNKRVLLADLDPQFNASQYLLGSQGYRELVEGDRPTVWDLFERNTRIPGPRRPPFDLGRTILNRWTGSRGGRLDLLPSRLELAYSLRTPYQQKERELADCLTETADEYDLILIDCPPTESLLTTAAYLASDYLLVPVKPEYLSAIGLPLLQRSLVEFHERYSDHQVKVAGLVFNACSEYVPEEILSKANVRDIALAHHWYVFESEVPYSRSFARSAREAASIYATPYTRRRTKTLFSAVAQELQGRVGI